MTEVTNSFTSIKRELATFQHNQQQLRERLNHINQTRSKINNQLVNLTKDYERKIKELQNKLEEAINKNEQLSKENKLYKKQMQAFQGRLLEKEKLIAMLIVQQNDRFSSESHIARSKNQYQKTSQKGKESKKNYESILPKSVNTVQTMNFIDKPDQANEQEGQRKKFIKKQQPQSSTTQLKSEIRKTEKHHHNEQIHPLVSIEQQLNKNQYEKLQDEQKQENKKGFNEGNDEEKDTINTSRTKNVPPPAPRAPQIKNKNKAPQMPKNTKTVEPFNNQQHNIKQESDIVETKEEKPIQNNKDLSSRFDDNIENTGIQVNYEKNQTTQKVESSINSQQRKSRIPPPPPRSNKNKATQKKNSPIPIFQPKFLQDKGSTPKKQEQQVQQQHEQIRPDAEEDNNQNKQYFQLLRQDHQEKQNQQPYNNTALGQAFGFEQMNEDIKDEGNIEKQIQNQNIQEDIQENIMEQEQVQNIHRSVPPPPPPKHSSKPSKNKGKNPPSLPKQTRTFHQNQNTEQTHQQAQSTSNQYQFSSVPHSSQDFFANLGTDQTQSNQQYGFHHHKNPMIEAEQSSIDYADTNSIVSSSAAAYMLDSQYIPQQSTTALKQTETTTPDVKRMPKKKQGKREVKHIDPESFV